MTERHTMPSFVFESSWEVCNKVGGIYTVLSTRAKTMQEALQGRVVFIGPDVWGGTPCPYFEEDSAVLADWTAKAAAEGLKVRAGRWKVPGEPMAVLVDFTPYYDIKNEIYAAMWEDFGVDSLHAYGDYDEASMFSYAAALVVESMHAHGIGAGGTAVYHGNEWMAGLGLLHVRKHAPAIATIFTTHATSIGRSIAGNNKPLYDYMPAYDGDQMACELNMQSKHSIEKQTALHCDCFTTVSDITAKECAQLIGKPVDKVLPNGFEDNFVPRGAAFTKARKAARARLLQAANALTGRKPAKDALIISTSGRYEFRNKGIDVFIEALDRLNGSQAGGREIVAFIEVPAWVGEARADLAWRMAAGGEYSAPLENPVVTHWLHDISHDSVLEAFRRFGMDNRGPGRVTAIFVPCYLNGADGIMDMAYYDLVLGNDLCVYPSYYEPWGYTPLEAAAFHVPCITTDLAGFGLWADVENGGKSRIEDGVEVIHRTDYNYHEVAQAIADTVERYAAMDEAAAKKARAAAAKTAKKALWGKFMEHYKEAYSMAVAACKARAAEDTKEQTKTTI